MCAKTERTSSSNGRRGTGGEKGRRGEERKREKDRARAGTDERGVHVNAGYAGTLTPPDYPMNRNVIYGSFSGLEGWRESRVDRAIAYNTSRHFAPQTSGSSLRRRTLIYTRLPILHIFYHNTVDTFSFTDRVEYYRGFRLPETSQLSFAISLDLASLHIASTIVSRSSQITS